MGAENLTLVIAAGAGLLSFASPCVVPLVPGYLGYLTGAAAGTAAATSAGQGQGSAAARSLQSRGLIAHALSFVLRRTVRMTRAGGGGRTDGGQ